MIAAEVTRAHAPTWGCTVHAVAFLVCVADLPFPELQRCRALRILLVWVITIIAFFSLAVWA